MLLLVMDMCGVAVFAVSGALAAGRKHLDLIGVLVLGVVTAVGGGTLRDLLLDRHPVFWIAEPWYIVVAAGAAVSTFLFVRGGHPSRAARMKALLYADAAGLAFFAVSGAQIAERLGQNLLIAILMGTMTGTAGGAIRDVLTAEIPLVMRKSELYATAAAAGATAYLVLHVLGVPYGVSALIGMATTLLLRLAAIRWKLELPTLQMAPDDPPAREQPGPPASDAVPEGPAGRTPTSTQATLE